jgi:transcriptional regulator with GAF, ATPase, and Fis domain
MVAVHGLFEIGQNAHPAEVMAYAKSTFVPFEWVNSRLDEHHGRSFLGIPLEVNGAPWGALVVDSRSEEEITTKAALKNPRYKILTEMLSKLLQT